MAQFDPYHKWLGIPPEEQPPNHYRLLGVSVFEPDADVIDAAANQRMAWLQDMASGPHVDLSQKLLNEISAARRCLLNPETKAAYDETLREQLTPAVTSAPTEPAEETPPEPSAEKSKSEEAGSESQQKTSVAVVASIASVSVITLVVALAMIFRGGGGFGGVELDGLLLLDQFRNLFAEGVELVELFLGFGEAGDFLGEL